jgi:hypothetical protein
LLQLLLLRTTFAVFGRAASAAVPSAPAFAVLQSRLQPRRLLPLTQDSSHLKQQQQQRLH